ncbi:MAG: hypothetical protein V1895_04070 [Parcubacteria group bacterium]
MEARPSDAELAGLSVFRSLGLVVPRHREWWIVGLIALVFGLLAVSPQIVALISSGTLHSTGLPLTNNIDHPAYLDIIWQAQRGELLFSNSLTAEASPHVQLRPLFLVLGWFSAITRLAPALVWNLSIALAASLLAIILYLFIAQLFVKCSERIFALIVTLTSGGLGWVNLWVPGWWQVTPTDLAIPESNTLHAATCCSHFSWSQTLLLGIALLLWFGARRWIWSTVLAGILSLLLVLDHPYDLPLIALVAVLALILAIVKKQPVRAALARVAGAGLGAALGAGIVWWGLQASPQLRQWNGQNVLPSGPLWPWLLGFGLLLFYALFGVVVKRSWATAILAIWAVAQGVLVFVPLSFARRLSEGWHIPIALLATFGILALSRRWSVRIAAALLVGLFSIALISDQWSLSAKATSQDRVRPFFELGSWQTYPDSYRQGFDWLREHYKPQDVVASSPTNGGLIVAETGARVVAGHWAQTIDPITKHAALADLFAERTTLAEFSQRYNVTYLWLAREEQQYLRELGRSERDLVGKRSPVFANHDVSIYELQRQE